MSLQETRRGPRNQPERYFAGVANPDLRGFLVKFDTISVKTTPVISNKRQRVDQLFWKLIEAEGWGDRANPQAWYEIKAFGRKVKRERVIDLPTILGGQELHTSSRTNAYAFAALVWGMRNAPLKRTEELAMIVQRTKAALGDHPLAAEIKDPGETDYLPEIQDFSDIEDDGYRESIEGFRNFIKTDTRPTMSIQGFLWHNGLGRQLGMGENTINSLLRHIDQLGIMPLIKSKGAGESVTLITKNQMYVLAAVAKTLKQHYPIQNGFLSLPPAKDLPWKEIVGETKVALGKNPLSQLLDTPPQEI